MNKMIDDNQCSARMGTAEGAEGLRRVSPLGSEVGGFDGWWTPRQAAQVACVSEWSIRRWLRSGKLKRAGVVCRKPGRAWQIDSDSFCMWLLELSR